MPCFPNWRLYCCCHPPITVPPSTPPPHPPLNQQTLSGPEDPSSLGQNPPRYTKHPPHLRQDGNGISLDPITPVQRETTTAPPAKPYQATATAPTSSGDSQRQASGLWEAVPGPISMQGRSMIDGSPGRGGPPLLPTLMVGTSTNEANAGAAPVPVPDEDDLPPPTLHRNSARLHEKDKSEHEGEEGERPRRVEFEEKGGNEMTAALPGHKRARVTLGSMRESPGLKVRAKEQGE